MKVPTSILNLVIKSLSESMNITTMQSLARSFLPNYDLHRETGFPDSIAIPNRDAARQIVTDINRKGLFIHFINRLFHIQSNGLMGKKYSISYLREIINGVIDLGYVFDHKNRLFVEDSRIQRTNNWGILMNNEDYMFSFLRVDIVGNTKLLKKYPYEAVSKAYTDVRTLLENSVYRFNGRIWKWEGDGGLASFYFSDINLCATLTGMQFIHDVFLYNRLECALEEPVSLRVAVHTGRCEYRDNVEDLLNHDIIKKTIELESRCTMPDTLTVSNVVHITLGEELGRLFTPVRADSGTVHYNYKLRWED